MRVLVAVLLLAVAGAALLIVGAFVLAGAGVALLVAGAALLLAAWFLKSGMSPNVQ